MSRDESGRQQCPPVVALLELQMTLHAVSINPRPFDRSLRHKSCCWDGFMPQPLQGSAEPAPIDGDFVKRLEGFLIGIVGVA
jgi:hypothetical protein